MNPFKKIVVVFAVFSALSASFIVSAEESGAFVDRNKSLNERGVGS
jgi:hypothetical protein